MGQEYSLCKNHGGNAQQAVAAVEKQSKNYAGNIPFTYNFLDVSFNEHYKSDQHAGALFNVFAGIAIFISCLGLFGLATYRQERSLYRSPC